MDLTNGQRADVYTMLFWGRLYGHCLGHVCTKVGFNRTLHPVRTFPGFLDLRERPRWGRGLGWVSRSILKGFGTLTGILRRSREESDNATSGGLYGISHLSYL